MASSMAPDRLTHPRRPARGRVGRVSRRVDRWSASEHAARSRTAALAFLVVYVVARLIPLGSRIDESLRGAHHGGTAAEWSGALLVTLTPSRTIVVALALCVAVWRRSGLRAGSESAVSIGLAFGLAESLKAVLPTVVLPTVVLSTGPHLVIGSSFPSGHTATVTALGLTLLTLSPEPSPPWGWMLRGSATLLPLTVGVTLVVAGWHSAGDVVGGLLLAIAVHHGVRAVSRRRATTGTRLSAATT